MGIVFWGKKVLVLENEEKEWVFPKGHPEREENDIASACREIFEEAGILVKRRDLVGYVGKFAFSFHKENRDIVKSIYVYAFSILNYQPIIISEKCFLGGEWVDINLAENLLTHNDARSVFKRAVKMLGQWDTILEDIFNMLNRIEKTIHFKRNVIISNYNIQLLSDSHSLLQQSIGEVEQFTTETQANAILSTNFNLFILNQSLTKEFLHYDVIQMQDRLLYLGDEYQKKGKIFKTSEISITFADDDKYTIVDYNNNRYLFIYGCKVDYGVQVMREIRHYIYTQNIKSKCSLLHAAALRFNNHNILICGDKGSGKTTTLCKLLSSPHAQLYLSNDKLWISCDGKKLYAYTYPLVARVGPGTLSSIKEFEIYLSSHNLYRKQKHTSMEANKNGKFEITPLELSRIFSVPLIDCFEPDAIIITHFSDKNYAFLLDENAQKKEYLDEHILCFGSPNQLEKLYNIPMIHFYSNMNCNSEELYHDFEKCLSALL